MAKQDIVITIKAINEASGIIDNVSKSLDNLNSGQVSKFNTSMKGTLSNLSATFTPANEAVMGLDESLKTGGISMKEFNKFSKENFLTNQEGAGMMNKLTGQTMTYGEATQKAVTQGRRFKMQWLGIMFTGMAINRVFGGMVKKQLDLFGVTELYSDAISLVMMPAILNILPALFEFADTLMNLPDSVKTVLGFEMIGLAGLGGAMLIGGQAGLAVQALKGFGVSESAMKIIGKGIGIAVGLSISFIGLTMLWEANKSGNLKDALMGGLATAIGFGTLGFMAGGAAGGAAGLVLGVTIGLAITYNILSEEFIDSASSAQQYMDDTVSQYASSNADVGTQFGTRGAKSGLGVPEDVRAMGINAPEGQSVAMKVDNSPVYNIQVSDTQELQREFESHDRSLMDEIKSMISIITG